MTPHAATNINTAAYWDEVYRKETATGRQRVDAVRLGQLERWTRMREEEIQRAASVLDFGCGRGDALFGLWTACHSRQLFGMDISQAAVTSARKERHSLGAHDVTFLQGSAKELDELRDQDIRLDAGLPGGGVDIIWCGETLEHLDAPRDAIHCFKQILGDNGLLVLSTPFKGRNRSPEHRWEFSPGDVVDWAESVGELVFLDCLLLPSWLTMFAVIRKGTRT